MATYDLLKEKLLLEQIANGDEYAFRQVFETYKGRVYTFVVNYIHSEADAEEIVQETFMTLWQNRMSLGRIDHPRNYIYTVVRNKTINYMAKAARNEKILRSILASMSCELNPVEERMNLKESHGLIRNAVSHLSEQKQKVFFMSREQGLNHEQIAAETGLSKSRVKNIIVEVLKYIKLHLSESAKIISLLLFLFFRSDN